jgi:hypothetical protein
MRNLIVAALASLFIAHTAFAADAACEAKAAEKKLAGAARNSFIAKCEKDTAAASCEAKAVSKDGKPLAGAAKAASIKKCEADAKAAK